MWVTVYIYILYVYIHMHMYMYLYMYVCVCICVWVCVCLYVYVYLCVCMYVHIYVCIISSNKLNTNYYKPIKDSREHFVINTVIISAWSRVFVTTVLELFLTIVNCKEIVDCCHRELHFGWDGILGSISVNPSYPDHGQREKINLKFLFWHFFVVPQKVIWRP